MKKRMISILLSMVLFLANVPAVNAADKAVAPSKPIVTLSVPTLISGEYHVGDSVYPEWDWGDNVTHYNSYWEKKNNLGKYETYTINMYDNMQGLISSGAAVWLSETGSYRYRVEAVNTGGYSDEKLWSSTFSDWEYFTVVPSSPNVPVTNIELVSRFSLQVGKSVQVKAKVKPDDADNGSILWGYSDPTIADVQPVYNEDDNYATTIVTITAKKAGTLYISAWSKAMDKVANCTIVVTDGPVNEGPVVTMQPENVLAVKGKSAKFCVAASGNELKYQWQRKKPGGSWTNSSDSGNTTANLVVKDPAGTGCNGYQYRCVISDKNGNSIYSDAATLTVSSVVASGYCGKGVKWKLNDEGVLTISGKGDMYNYDLIAGRNVPWGNYELKKVVVEAGVTSIGAYAFSLDFGLNQVTIPDGIKYIGEWAFSNTAIGSIYLPDGLTWIGEAAFYRCRSLTDVVVPESVTYIGRTAFAECDDLTRAELPDRVDCIRSGLFADCSNLQSITLPSRVNTISQNAFYGCSSLKEIVIPSKVETIMFGAFEKCTNLKKIEFMGDAPDIDATSFAKVRANVYYPKDNATWTFAKRQNYGGTLSWIAKEPEREKFVLGRDNNSFLHSTSGSRAGFEDVTGHDVPLSLYLDLLKHMNVENMIILTLIIGTSEWSGSCHGIAATMALAFADELDLSQIESGVEYYYDMSLPCDNKKFLDCIEYFYLGQIAMDYQGGSGSELKNVFPELIKELDENPVLFSYRYSGGGHTILALDYKKDIDGSYLVTMYDMNSYYSGSKGRFTELKISKDYGSFSLTTPSGTVLTENEISYLQFSTVDDVNEINPYSGVESARNAEGSNGKVEFADATVITIPMTEHSFEIENSRGEKLICDENGRFSGSMEILGMKGFFSDVQSDSAWELTVANSDYFRLVKSDAAINLGFYSGESCMVIDGENLGHVTVVPGSSIEIEPAEEADTYDFSAYLSADMVEDYGVRVVQISGTASGKTTLNVDDGRICAAADSLISKELVLIDGVDKYPLGDLDSRDNIIELAADRPTVKVNNAAAGPGCEVDVSICIDNNPGIADMVLEMEYDPSVMSLCKVTDEGALGNPVNADDMGQIPYRFGWSNDRNYAANGNVITLTFRISEDADIGEYPLQLKLCSALDESSNEVTLAVDNSVLSIKPGYVSSEVPDGCGIIVLGGYDFGQLVDCRVVTDPGVTVTEKVDGDEVWMFFLEENTYAPVCPAKRVRD